MSERLLLRYYFDVIRLCIGDQIPDFIRSKRTPSWANKRMLRTRECMLHVEGVHVEFVHRKGPNLSFDVFHRGNRASTNVVRYAAPAHRGPVDDVHTLNEHIC